MNEPQNLLDSDGYPTDELLQWIKEFDILEHGVEPLLEIINETWNWPDWGIVRKRSYNDRFSYELHTGGWSGNEEIVAALRANQLFFYWWRKSLVGGHYYFRFPVKSFFETNNQPLNP